MLETLRNMYDEDWDFEDAYQKVYGDARGHGGGPAGGRGHSQAPGRGGVTVRGCRGKNEHHDED